MNGCTWTWYLIILTGKRGSFYERLAYSLNYSTKLQTNTNGIALNFHRIRLHNRPKCEFQKSLKREQ